MVGPDVPTGSQCYRPTFLARKKVLKYWSQNGKIPEQNCKNPDQNGKVPDQNGVNEILVTANANGTNKDPEKSDPKYETEFSDPDEPYEPYESNLPTPPDGGWGWWVVFASFMIHVIGKPSHGAL